MLIRYDSQVNLEKAWCDDQREKLGRVTCCYDWYCKTAGLFSMSRWLNHRGWKIVEMFVLFGDLYYKKSSVM
jgi:hypothetical protein